MKKRDRGPNLVAGRWVLARKGADRWSLDNPVHLVASHCKPWRDSSNEERLNGENGLLLTPSIDHLFDRGFIGFENNGALIIHQSRIVPHFNGWVSTPQKPSTWGSSLAAKSSFLISTGTRCSSNLSAASTRGRTAVRNRPNQEQHSTGKSDDHRWMGPLSGSTLA
jgi:hypothetical protein